MKTWHIAIVFTLGAALVALPGQARPPLGAVEGMDMEQRLERLADHLSFSAEQEASARELLARGRSAVAGELKRMAGLREEIEAQARDFDAGRAQQLATEMGEISARLAYARMETMSQLRALLSDEQRAQMDAFHERRQQRLRDRSGSGPWSR